jgi:hypothetical protein
MKTREQVAEELILKEERVSAWEQGNLLDNGDWRHEDLKVDYWYID